MAACFGTGASPPSGPCPSASTWWPTVTSDRATPGSPMTEMRMMMDSSGRIWGRRMSHSLKVGLGNGNGNFLTIFESFLSNFKLVFTGFWTDYNAIVVFLVILIDPNSSTIQSSIVFLDHNCFCTKLNVHNPKSAFNRNQKELL